MSLLHKRERERDNKTCEMCESVRLVNEDGVIVEEIGSGVAVISVTGVIHFFAGQCEETPQIIAFAEAAVMLVRGKRCTECGRCY